MKRLILTCLLLCISAPLIAQTGTVTLVWDANPAAEQVTQYTVYRSSSLTGPWTKVQDVTGTTVTITALSAAVYFFRVTATNLWGESGPSNVVSSPPPAGSPTNLKITLAVQVTVVKP